MVHTFKVDCDYYLYDTGSGSLHSCDEQTYLVVKGEHLERVSPLELAEINRQLLELKQSGLLYSEEITSAPPKSGFVKALCLHICHDCNLRCGYCFAGEGAYKGARLKMDLKTAEAAVDFLINNSGDRRVLEIDFFGGEPLMNFEVLRETVIYAKEKAAAAGKEFLFTTTTNGLLLRGEIADFLNAEMENVVLSLDGMPQTHDAVRKTISGGGSFFAVEKNISEFVKKRGDKSYYVRGTFTAKNPDFKKDVIFLADRGYKQLSVEPVVLPKQSELYIDQAAIERINAEYEELAKEYIDRIGTEGEFNLFHFNIDLEGGPCLQKRVSACGAGNEYFSVTPSGNIFPCHQFADNPDFCMGNIYDGNLDIKLRDKFKNSSLFTRKGCETCFAKFLCSGGCAANNYNFCGDIDSPYQPTCQMMKKRLECAMHILAKRKEKASLE